MFGTKGRLKKIKGSLLQPEAIGIRYVLIPVATDGKTDSPILKKWISAQKDYRAWYCESFGSMERFLGKTRQSLIQSDLIAVQMLCIHNEVMDMKAFKSCLVEVCKEAKLHYGSLHLEDFDGAEKIMEVAICDVINVNIY